MKRLLCFIIIFLFLLTTACEKLEKRIEHYKDGSQKEVARFKDGKRQGTTTGFYKNGKKKYEQQYKDGKKHGELIRWYDNGQVSARGNFAQNLLHGPITFYNKKGQKKLEGEYKNGKEHGIWVRYYENGKKQSQKEYKEGIFHGRWKQWNNFGKLVKSELYSDGFYEKPAIKGDYLGQPGPGLTPEIFASGVVSTDKWEFGGTFSPDKTEFYFTRKEDVYDSSSIYHMKQEKEGGRWTVPRPAAVSGKYDDIEPMITVDARRLFFGSDRPLPTESQTRSTDIWFMDWSKNGWSEPHNAGPNINSPEREFYVSATDKGTIYFAGTGKGGGDIFRSRLDVGQYTPRERLGNNISTDAHETHPFIAPDESYLIFFSTPRGEGQNKKGLFICFRESDNTWTSPQFMGRVINGEHGAECPMVTPDGKYLFFSRLGDIYWVDSRLITRLKKQK